MERYQEIFDQVCKIIEPEITHTSFVTWIEPLRIVNIENDKLTIEAPHELCKNFINARYNEMLVEIIKKVTGKNFVLEVLTAEEISKYHPFLSENDNKSDKVVKSQFNPKYTFDNFIVGDNNKYAHAFCLSVAEAPSMMYNPLFLYGGVGLGKTHLMHAIGNFIQQEYPEKRVLYVTAEKFTNDYINSITNMKNGSENFRNSYRNLDVLLIDDIQFLCGKNKSQEEFFHTFNALKDANSQIICSSDKSPKDLPNMEERMRSRFEWGLITDIKQPDLETRAAILRKKAENENINIDNDVLLFIANKVDSNVRELEGSLIRVMAFATLLGKNISMDLAEEALKDYFQGKTKVITGELVIEVVSNHFGLTREDLASNRRDREVTVPRHIAMYLCREMTDMSLPSIGRIFGNRHHTTVINGYDNVKDEIKTSVSVRTVVNDLKKRIMEN